MLKNFIRVPYVSTVHDQNEIDAVVNALKTSTQMGHNTKKFEQEVASLYGHKYGVATNSGSSSLYLSMECFDLPEGSEVITPAINFATTVGCKVKNKLMAATVITIDKDELVKDISYPPTSVCVYGTISNCSRGLCCSPAVDINFKAYY